MRTQPVGSQVTLDLLMVDQVGAGYLIVREPTSVKETVLVAVGARVKRWQSVEVTGTIARADDGSLYLSQACVKAYADKSGKIILFPLPKPWNDMKFCFDTVDVTLGPGESDDSAPDAPTPPDMLDSLTPGTIPDAKSLANGQDWESVSDEVLTAKFADHFYVQEPNMPAGIRVNATPPAANIGQLLSISGTMATTEGERAIDLPTITGPSGSADLYPLGMPNKSIGGDDWLCGDGGAGQQGVIGAKGLNNIGLLVRAWGHVTDYGDDYVVINDGSNVGLDGVNVDLAPGGLVHHLGLGDKVAVTAISSCTEVLGGLVRKLKPRLPGDVVDLLDTTGPTTPVVTAAEFSACTNKLYATWSATDAESGIVGYNYAVGTSPTSLVVGWKDDWIPAASNEILCTGSFSPGVNYYFYLKVLNGAGIPSVGVATSNATQYQTGRVVYAKYGSSGNGSSWTNAYGSLATALDPNNVAAGQEIWVAEETYAGLYSIPSGVDVYGGFAGDECAREQRDWNAHPTVLSGGNVGWATVTVADDTKLDGFVVRDGAPGIYAYSADNVEISHNTVTANDAGIVCAMSTASVHDNYVYDNEIMGLVISECASLGTLAVNNTIVDNGGEGIWLEYATVAGVYNNIVARNSFGVYDYTEDSVLTLRNNCVFGNSGGNYTVAPDPSQENISVDPKLDGVHLKPSSPCIGEGTNTAIGSGWRDFDDEFRAQPAGGTVDIGADENDGCGVYTIALTRDPPYATPGNPIEVTAHITDWNGQPVEGARVAFSVTNGTITHINGQEAAGPDYHGYTDASGDITATVTRPTSGNARLTAVVPRSCGLGTTTKSRTVSFFHDNEVDWPMFMRDAQHTGANPLGDDSPETLTLAWSAEVHTASTGRTPDWLPHNQPGGPTGGYIFAHPYIDSSPVVVGNLVVVGTWTRSTNYSNATGSVKAFNGETGGNALWTATGTPSMGGVASTPCVVGGKVYVGTTNGHLYCLDLATGTQLWTQPTYDRSSPAGLSKIIASPVVHNGAVYIGNEAAKVYAFDAVTGNLLANYPIVLPIDSHGISNLNTQNMTGTSSPAVAELSTDYVLIGCDDGYIYRFTAGTSDPQATLVGANLGYCVESSPTVMDTTVYVGISHYNGNQVYRLSVEPFQILSGANINSPAMGQECRATLACDPDYLYVGVDTGTTFHKIVPSTLTDAVTEFSAPSYFVGSAALCGNGLVYIGNDDGTFRALTASGLSLSAAYYAGAGFICSSPAIAYNVDVNHNRWVYVTTRNQNGRILAFRTVR